MSKEQNPTIECGECGLIFTLHGEHEIDDRTRLRCPRFDCAYILKPIKKEPKQDD